jgi:hypothetical protein
MMKLLKSLFSTALLVAGITSVHASPSIGLTEDFSGVGDVGGFTSQDAVTTLSNPNSGGNPGGYLRIEFPSQGVPTPQEDTIINIGLEYTGDYSLPDLRLEFDFLAEDYLPTDTALYFHSTVDNDIWALSFTQATLGWRHHSIAFQYTAGWTRLGTPGNSTDFLNALASVDWVGINIVDTDSDTNPEHYGLDNWSYAIPGPGDFAIALAVLIPLLFRYRTEINQWFQRSVPTSAA